MCYYSIMVKYTMAMSTQWRFFYTTVCGVNYHLYWQLPNGQLQAAVATEYGQLRIIASEMVDIIDWTLPPTHYSVKGSTPSVPTYTVPGTLSTKGHHLSGHNFDQKGGECILIASVIQSTYRCQWLHCPPMMLNLMYRLHLFKKKWIINIPNF